MEDKIKKFLELSREFTIKSEEIYGSSGNSIYVMGSGNYSIKQQNNPIETITRLEQFTKLQELKIEKAKRYEEYLELQSSLSDYYIALEKLI